MAAPDNADCAVKRNQLDSKIMSASARDIRKVCIRARLQPRKETRR